MEFPIIEHWLGEKDGILEYARNNNMDCDCYHTERQGDPIALFVKKGTDDKDLPRRAKGYSIIVWEHLDANEYVVMYGNEPQRRAKKGTA